MKTCAACAKPVDPEKDGVELWSSWFCSTCFISRSQDFHRPIRPEDVALLKLIGQELSGLLPTELVEMILVGYYRRTSGREDTPPRDETLRAVGEIQRLSAFALFRRTLSMLRTWNDAFNELVETQEEEIRRQIRRITSGEL